MSIIYNETLGNAKITYTAFCEKDEETNQLTFGVTVKDNLTESEVTIRNFTGIKERVIDFIETLIRNNVSPESVKEIAEDYLIA